MTCGCGQVTCSGNCGCARVGSSVIESNRSSCCENSIPATPNPCYAPCENFCQEDHCKNTFINQFFTSIRVKNSWNIPACGATAVLTAPHLESVTLGSYIWNSYGYFEITGFNQNLNQITVRNNCTTGNESPGTTIPSCTDFVVSDPPDSGQGTNFTDIFPYVAIDFTAPPVAPAVGSCIDITVTTVNGLSIGKNVQIAGGTYLLNGISSATVINICNEGSGVTPGTPIIALNDAGDYQYPVILIDANPCTNDTVTQGSILVCHNDIQQTLSGTIAGMVPTLVDPDTGEVTFQAFDFPFLTCTVLDACVIISEGDDVYIISVADTSIFTIGDLVRIDDIVSFFEITDIIDDHFMEVTIQDPYVGDPLTLDPGTKVCLPSCCEQLEIDLEAFEASLAVGAASSTNGSSGNDLTSGTPTASISTAVINLANPSLTKTMRVFYTVDISWHGEAIDMSTHPTAVAWNILTNINGGGFGIRLGNFLYMNAGADSGVDIGNSGSYSAVQSIAPNTTETVQAQLSLQLTVAATAAVSDATMDVTLTYIAVAV